jgi:hypothetical protein
MDLAPVVQVHCTFRTIRYAPLSPFVWAVLKFVDTFYPRSRPELEVLAGKLSLPDESFLKQAWLEAESSQLISSKYLQSATLTKSGKAALRLGFIEVGRYVPRDEPIYFILGNGKPIEWKTHYEAKEQGAVEKPKWADRLNEKVLRKALQLQMEAEELTVGPDQKILDAEYHWATAKLVNLAVCRS